MPGTTPIYGFPYPEPTDLVADYPALGQQLAEDIEAVLPTLGGLSPATPTSIANSGGTATLSGNTVTATGVTTVSLNGIFSNTYDNYRLLVAGTNTTGDSLRLRYRAAGTDAAGTDYYNRVAELGAAYATTGGSATSTILGIIRTNRSLFSCEIGGVRTTGTKTTTSTSQDGAGTTSFVAAASQFTVASTYDGVTIFPGSGSATILIACYAYKK